MVRRVCGKKKKRIIITYLVWLSNDKYWTLNKKEENDEI
jgi:hypothetical protein